MSMNLTPIFIIVASLIVTACSENDMTSKVGAVRDDGSSANASDAKVQTQDANEPVMVAGGFLACQVSDDDRWQSHRDAAEVIAVVDCSVQDQQGEPQTVADPDSATFNTYTSDGDLTPVDIAAIVEERGTHWILPVTTFTDPWLIRAELANGQTLETEIDPGSLTLPMDAPDPIELGQINSDAPAFSLGPEVLANGSFDEPAVVDPQFSDETKSWGHYAPTAVTGWEAQWNNTTCANNVRLEIQRQFQDGDQFTDLAGSCQFGVTPPPGGSNLSLAQTVPTNAGSVYQLSFNYLVQNAQSVAFQVEGPEGILFDTADLDNVAQNVWQEVTVQFVAVDASSRLTFSEAGQDPLQGTLLDNVSLREVRRKLIE
jgi:hypothetical protein